MTNMMCCNIPVDRVFIRRWLEEYDVFQGIDGDTRNAISVYIARNVVSTQQIQTFDPMLVVSLENELRTTILDRKWFSLASKVLAAQNPEIFPMYDSFVHQSLSTLQWLEPSLIGAKRIGAPRNPRKNDYQHSLVQFYGRYAAMIFSLQDAYHTITTTVIPRNSPPARLRGVA
jgi:hypothetical protein